ASRRPTPPVHPCLHAHSLLLQRTVAVLADVPRLPPPEDRGLVAKLAVAMPVEAALDDVHPRSDPPFRPGLAMRQVHDLLVLAVESDVDILDGRVPEPLDVVVGALEQLVECLDPVPVHES